jgi:ribosomal protein S18 acetylase RimI-like enzyme
VSGRAGSFARDVAPFSGIEDGSAESWADLAALLGANHPAVLFRPKVNEPGGWSRDADIPCLQMVATDVDVSNASEEGLVELGPEDADDMLALVAETQPGPFLTRTIAMGRYLGVRRDGKLVAMTGERFHPPGFTEVSAVCTSESARGEGLGRKLVLAIVANIRARGEEAFLHVMTTNAPAIGLYESMGFTTRCEAEAVILRTPSGED